MGTCGSACGPYTGHNRRAMPTRGYLNFVSIVVACCGCWQSCPSLLHIQHNKVCPKARGHVTAVRSVPLLTWRCGCSAVRCLSLPLCNCRPLCARCFTTLLASQPQLMVSAPQSLTQPPHSRASPPAGRFVRTASPPRAGRLLRCGCCCWSASCVSSFRCAARTNVAGQCQYGNVHVLACTYLSTMRGCGDTLRQHLFSKALRVSGNRPDA